MWIAIFFVGLILLIGHALYFSGRITRALRIVAPGTQRWLRSARGAYLVVACSVPLLALGYAAYLAIARPDTMGPPATRAYDLLIAYPFWVVTIISFQCTLLIVPLDVVHLILARLHVASGPRWTRRKNTAVLALAAGMAIFVPIRIAIDDRSLTVRRHVYASSDVPAELDGFEIALVADMQADRYTDADRQAQLVDAVNRERPDLIVIAGDMITGAPDYIEVAATYAGKLRARHGVVACIGDHDHFAYFRDRARSLREVREALARHGVPMLDNEVREIAIGDARIAVILATNNYVSRIERPTTRALLERARASDVQVVVAHQTGTDLVADARDAGVDLFLTGHTHGGQMRFWLPLYDLAFVRFETPYVAGGYWVGDMLLAVSNGLGVSVTPFRYRTPATFELIELRASASRGGAR
jgi:predicted MPP superfamily phosphohydrolase